MISVEQIVQELLRLEAELPGCAARCEQCVHIMANVMNELSSLYGEPGGVQPPLSLASDELNRAQAELEQLRGGIQNAILRLEA